MTSQQITRPTQMYIILHMLENTVHYYQILY